MSQTAPATPSGWESRRRILEMMRGYRSAQVLITCAELGVFEALQSGVAAVEELGERLDANVSALGRLLNTAVALGLLEKSGARYANSALAETCLAAEGPFYLGNLVKREGAFYRRWTRLAEAVRGGERPEENRGDEQQENWVREFELALYDVARTAAPAIAEVLDPLLPQRESQPIGVIDIGGGHGAYAVALARSHATLEAVVFDLPAVIAVVADLVAAPDIAGRVTLRAGDFRVDDLGTGFDLALLFGVLVSETPADSVALLRKVHAALLPGGMVAIRGFYLDPDRSGPLEATLGDLHMLLSTDAGTAQTTDDVAAWLQAADFEKPEILTLPTERSSLIVARKPVG